MKVQRLLLSIACFAFFGPAQSFDIMAKILNALRSIAIVPMEIAAIPIEIASMPIRLAEDHASAVIEEAANRRAAPKDDERLRVRSSPGNFPLSSFIADTLSALGDTVSHVGDHISRSMDPHISGTMRTLTNHPAAQVVVKNVMTPAPVIIIKRPITNYRERKTTEIPKTTTVAIPTVPTQHSIRFHGYNEVSAVWNGQNNVPQARKIRNDFFFNTIEHDPVETQLKYKEPLAWAVRRYRSRKLQ